MAISPFGKWPSALSLKVDRLLLSDAHCLEKIQRSWQKTVKEKGLFSYD